MRDHATNRSRGFGFITFETEQAVDDLLEKGNKIDFPELRFGNTAYLHIYVAFIQMLKALNFREVLGDPPDGLPLEKGNQHQTNLIQGSIIPRQIYNLEETKELDLLQKGFIQESLSSDAILMMKQDLNNSTGFIVRAQRIHVNDEKVKVILDWPTPSSIAKSCRIMLGDPPDELSPKSPSQYAISMKSHDLQEYKDSRTNPFEVWGNDTCTIFHNTCFFGLMFILEPIRRTKSRRFKAYLFESEDDTCITRLTSKEEVITLPNDPLVQALERKPE
ncbi:hypothetical protein F3Y22_tig00111067pilonHSYRG00067 [Hibiscus syriacus]|uniref:RRM domain-containing protein n=1 Tax=Hibiscus syriacus TaxID=106335 RepID=A0A6A2Z365_HIBSY|nr:hypothetical protein F3Y22_tig00111067pilonHSYRG00067 [Hibiscus syriacus]